MASKFTDEDLAHMAVCTSQYDSTCRALAAELIKTRAKRPEGALTNPRSLPPHIVSALVSADRCPNCLGELDTGWECNSCGYDGKPWIESSRAKNEQAHDSREG